MFFHGLGTAVPASRYSQAECWQAIRASPQFSQLLPRSQAILKKVLHGKNGIASRHLALDDLAEAFQLTPDILHQRFSRHAPVLAAQAAERALAEAGSAAGEIDALIISTCTGYLCPGLTSYVSERLGLRADVQCLDLVGQGCGAALPNLRTAEALLAGRRARRVLSVCVEICSAAFYLDNDPGVLISACLFGDGAAAAVLGDTPSPNRRRVEWRAGGTTLSAVDRDYLRFEQKDGMLRNILARQVPALAAKHAETVLTTVLNETGTVRGDISGWILHAGGREVLQALQQRLSLSDTDVGRSSAILHDYGNLSSPFVLFVLEAALRGNAPGGWWWLASFGAGFSSHGALLKVD
jgi:predicted naringenin-chalcone synthase